MQEAIKLTTDPSAPDAKARRSAQNTLYTVLDNGLRMLHPFMPFVTEELWQRLPRRPTDQTKSIMLARFPEKKPERDFAQEEKEFDLAFGAVRASRSISTSYGINSKLQGASPLLILFFPLSSLYPLDIDELQRASPLMPFRLARSLLPRAHACARGDPARQHGRAQRPHQGLRRVPHRRERGRAARGVRRRDGQLGAERVPPPQGASSSPSPSPLSLSERTS